ncbi:unnamed protein product [Microthlaspi erraticum]|uniref:Uncharacterized protein n=1 Tax=Microthlaspi erraticum TaxID=1685480 RepID=A0A6D2HJN1_9BRAS|nr:unnamed protein product [Microthlaspi erraticum]
MNVDYRFSSLQNFVSQLDLRCGAEGTPEYANPSVVDEEEVFPSLLYYVDIFTQQPDFDANEAEESGNGTAEPEASSSRKS